MNNNFNNNPNNNPNSMNTFPNGRYGPFGHNDNNQNRQRVPSNVFPPNGGMPGSQSGRFNQLTTNTQNLMNTLPSMTNFNKAFQPNAPIIESYDYKNYNELLHNNVGESVINEHITEYKINIDSLDRDINVYKNPFSFTVKFNPPSTSTIKVPVRADYNDNTCTRAIKLENTVMHGPPTPHISKEFKNVKYIRLDNIILPYHTNIVKKDGKHIFDESDLLIDDRFVILRIRELEDDKGIIIYSTGDDNIRHGKNGDINQYPRPFGIIYPDKIIGKNYYKGYIDFAYKTYKGSELGNINQLTIELYNSCGEQIKIKNCDDSAPMSDIRHPLNKKNQMFLSFTIGVVESQINTNTKFEP